MAEHRFRGGDERVAGAEDALDGGGLAGVVQLRARAVGDDGADLGRVHAGASERAAQRQLGARPVRIGRGDVVRVARDGNRGDRGVDVRAALLRARQRLEHEHGRALGGDEARPAGVERSRQRGGIALGGRQRAGVGEAAHQVRGQGCVARAGQNDVDVTALQRVEGLGDGDGACRARPHAGGDRAGHAPLDRGVGGGHVAGHERHVERAHAARIVLPLEHLLVALGDAAGAGVDRDRGARPGDVIESGVGQGEVARHERELGEAPHATRGALLDVRRQVEVGDRRGVPSRQSLVLLAFEAHDAGAVLHQRRPQRIRADPRGTDDADPGDGDGGVVGRGHRRSVADGSVW